LDSADLTPAERSRLLSLARHAIREALRGDGSLEPLLARTEITPGLSARGGAFVTLKKRGRLRGCVGIMESERRLIDTVIQIAPRAALEDSRFPPLEADELDEVRLTVSVLTPLREIDGPDRIVIGRHGVQLEEDAHRAVFLPEVAADQGWDVTQLLERLAVKAGLAPGLRPGTRLWTFRTQAFSEPAPGRSS
jgi:AmmeMemoRadiSam system protein A